MTHCRHCELEIPPGAAAAPGFCCAGCAAAHALVKDMGLQRYYARRRLDPGVRSLRPDDDPPPLDFAGQARHEADGTHVLHLMVEGLHCAACVWLIESVLARRADVISARLNMTTRRLVLKWRGDTDADAMVAPVLALGYRLAPFDPALLEGADEARQKELLRALAVAGFAAANVMLLSVSVWAGHAEGMGPATRGLLHWLSALIALPAIAYAGRPFFRSAVGALARGSANMDVPISLAVVLAAAISLSETVAGGPHAYFDSALALLFFLLIGRTLEGRARGRARRGVEHLLGLRATAVTVIGGAGERRLVSPSEVEPGMRVLSAAGERIAVDGTIEHGTGEVDTALITGESVPAAVAPGDRVFAGTVNLSTPLTVEVTAVGEETLLGEIVRLMEAAEGGRARYVALADRIARWYAPVVHILALATFLGWFFLADAGWREALLVAVAVLIVTCPCALALAVPAVQVIASGRLLRQGILVKSATALERLAGVDTVVFDKTGTLTEGRPELLAPETVERPALALAATLAHASHHPLARAVGRAAGRAGEEATVAEGVREMPGQGLVLDAPTGEVRLGSRQWCGVEAAEPENGTAGPELWLARPGRAPLRLGFADRPRTDAGAVVAVLRSRGYGVQLMSGDRKAAVAEIAGTLGIDDWQAGMTPADKSAALAERAAGGLNVLMVGDGLNDAPALAGAHVSLSPASAVDVSQNAADAVFQGSRLGPVVECLDVARRADRLVKQNFALAFLYNALAVPLAMAGLVTPLIAAVAMSASSLVVIGNALRLGRPGGRGAA